MANLFFPTPTTHHNLFPSLPLVCTLSLSHTNTCPAFFSRCVRSIDTGSVMQSFKHQLHRSKKIDFIEQFNEKLLVKQVVCACFCARAYMCSVNVCVCAPLLSFALPLNSRLQPPPSSPARTLALCQENEALQIIDIRTGIRTEVASSQFMTPSAFIFLYENQLFLTFRQRRSLLEKHVFFVNLKRDIVCLCLI